MASRGTAAGRARACLAALVVLASLGVGRSPAGAAAPAHDTATDRLDRVAAALAGMTDLPPPSPLAARPLAAEVLGVADLLGVPLDPAGVASRIRQARLQPATRSTLAALLARLAACMRTTQALLEATPLTELARAPVPAATNGLGACATDLYAQATAALSVLPASTARSDEEPVRLWPVLAYSPDGHDDTYRDDYVLLVDSGGDDHYVNNQGGNAIDLKRSLSSDLSRLRQPARGCETVFPDFTTGRIERGPAGERVLSYDGPECSAAAALLLDRAGDDTYGQYARPGFPDRLCTRDRVVRRISTIGSGVAGVGLLIDEAGDDRYLGKTGTQGAGHLGGVGLLEDRAGDDRYRAIRGAQGLGLLGAVGVLRDRGGDDRYGYRMPSPRDPDAPNQTDGAGGVVDDTGLGSEAGLGQQPGSGIGGTCDRLKRSVQGVGLLGGVGVFVEENGADRYRAPGYLNQPFFTLQGATIHLAHGSQGSGYLGGVGIFTDLGGRDRYRQDDGTRSQTRGDGIQRTPQADPVPDDDAPANGKPLDLSVFHDSG